MQRHKHSQRQDGEQPERRRLLRQEWERPAPSGIWREVGLLAIALATSAIIAALSLSPARVPQVSLLLALGATALLIAGLCFLANFDVNRGRRARRSEVIEERRDDERRRD